MKSREIIESILKSADIKINGDRPFDIHVKDERLYDRVLRDGTLGLGESYMDGWWDCERLDELIYRVLRFSNTNIVYENFTTTLHVLKSRFLNLQTKTGSKRVAKEHYDLGNDLYMAFLDPYNQYTCGYFKDTNDLNVAQEKKLDLLCKKLQLKPMDRVLDIGCGWGGFAKYAAEHYGCHVTGVSISEEQIECAKKFVAGLSVEIKNMDYRDINEKFDKIVSVGMFEHVGYKNYRTYFEIVKKNLREEGIFLLHCIGSNMSNSTTDPWTEKYIFRNSMLPSIKQIAGASEGLFVMEDWQNFGQYYTPTLLAWWKNFDNSWDSLKKNYDERFYRMFRYYLLSCAGAFRARDIQLWQVVFTPRGTLEEFKSVR